MRVAILTCVLPPYGGGIGTVAAAHAAILAKEHAVTVFTPRYPGRRSSKPITGVLIESLRPWAWLGNAAILPQLLWRLSDFDVIHLHYPFFGAQEWLLFALHKSQKLVVTYHMVPQAAGFKAVILRSLMKFSERWMVARAAVLFTQTQDFLQTVALPKLGHSSKWRVLPLGVSQDFSPGDALISQRRELKLRDSEQVILFVGTLDSAHEFKGLSVLLSALSQLNKLPVRLLIIGTGNLRQRYEREANSLGINKRTNFLGYVPNEALVSYFRLANLLLLPSTSMAETFGLVLLQAMAVGKPVIASRLPGVKELVEESGAGILVTPGDPLALAAALEHLLASPGEVEDMAARGRQAVEEKYNWIVIGEKLLDYYRTLP